MFNKILSKIKESSISISPIYLLILIISFTPLFSLSVLNIVFLTISTVIMIIGMALFNLGADLAMSPMGNSIGTGLTKQGNPYVLVIVCFIFGILITISEPDLSVLASQTEKVINSTALILMISCGVGLFLVLAILRTIFKKNLGQVLSFLYMISFALCVIVVLKGNEALIPLAYDSGGVTTGAITVPFLMALGVGISKVISKKRDKDASFGYIALCSIGPILAVLLLGVFSKNGITYEASAYTLENNYAKSYFSNLLESFIDVLIPLGLISLFFIIVNFIWLHIKKKRVYQLGIGMLYALLGLSLFLAAVLTSFMPIGNMIGKALASYSKWLVIGIAFLIGALTVLAEPAIHVLNKSVSEITSGLVKKSTMLKALTIGVGLSLALSVVRIVYDFNILYYIIPGYLICIGLSFFIPKVYLAIAFDSGGVASGPLTSSFILPLVIGICEAMNGEASVLSGAFGIVSMVAMTPILMIESVGLIALIKDKKQMKKMAKVISESDDCQIIEFEVK